MHSKQLHCIAESFTTRQTVLLNNIKFCHTTEKSISLQKLEKSSFYGRNINPVIETSSGRNRKVNHAAETGEKFLLRQKQRISPLCTQAGPNWVAIGPVSTPILRKFRPSTVEGSLAQYNKKAHHIKMATSLESWDQDGENKIFLPRKHVSKSLPKQDMQMFLNLPSYTLRKVSKMS